MFGPVTITGKLSGSIRELQFPPAVNILSPSASLVVPHVRLPPNLTRVHREAVLAT